MTVNQHTLDSITEGPLQWHGMVGGRSINVYCPSEGDLDDADFLSWAGFAIVTAPDWEGEMLIEEKDWVQLQQEIEDSQMTIQEMTEEKFTQLVQSSCPEAQCWSSCSKDGREIFVAQIPKGPDFLDGLFLVYHPWAEKPWMYGFSLAEGEGTPADTLEAAIEAFKDGWGAREPAVNYKLKLDGYKPPFVDMDLEVDGEFLRLSDGKIWTVLESYPLGVKAQDSETQEIVNLTYQEIKEMECVHTSEERRQQLYQEIVDDVFFLATLDRTPLE